MKLALVLEKYDPQGGGAERSTRQIALELASRGHAVTVICAQSEIPSDGDVAINLLPNSGKLHAARLKRFAGWAKSQIQQGDFDASISMTTTVPATILEPRSGTALETQRRNMVLYGPPWRLVKQCSNAISPKKRTLLSLERQTLSDPLLKHIAANSDYVRRQLVEHYQIPTEKMTVIPNAASLPEHTPQQRTTWRQVVRAGYRISDEQTAFVFAAMNPKLKGVLPLLAAFNELIEAEQPVVLMLAGKFSKRYVDLVNELDVREHVRFVGPTNEMIKLYAASDVLVHPTYYDPSSKVVIEALMLGIPAISTRYNGASDMITSDDGKRRGRVIDEPSDIPALVDAMAQLTDVDERKACSDAAQGLAQSLSMKVHVDRLESLLAQI